MIRLNICHIVPLWFAATATAGEITIEPKPFTIEKAITAGVLPDQGEVLVQFEPKVWTDYRIVEIAAHGSKVKKAEVLVRFDEEEIDKKRIDARRALESGALTLAQAEQDLKDLEQTAPHKLDSLRRAAETAKEENAYFTKIRRQASADSAAQSLERKKQFLSNQQEELKQLAKMYDADDLTEETEEIILTRQKDDVAAAEFALRMENLDYQRTLEVSLPRAEINLANDERDTAIALLKAEQEIPRSIALKKLEIAALKTAAEREKETLADLEHDRTLIEVKAPADGWFYHGPIENGRWTTGDAVKALVKHGRPAPNRPYATFVPASAKLSLTAFIDDATARSLKPELSGIAVLGGREDVEIPVKLARLAAKPGTDGSYRADFSAIWPKEPTPAVGASVQVRLIAYHQAAAIVVPSKALTYGAGGWTVEVKLADGKSERRPVKRGRVSGDDTEILTGLETGQVILAAEK